MKNILLVVGILAAVFAVRELFPKRTRVVGPPRIVTVWDTVRAIDTVWRARLRERTRHDTVNLVERVTVTVPETVQVFVPIIGLTTLEVGAQVGDSTLAGGFALERDTNGILLQRSWQAQIWTAGPLRSLVLDSLPPRASFYPPPPPRCGFFCKLTWLGMGTGVGRASCVLR